MTALSARLWLYRLSAALSSRLRPRQTRRAISPDGSDIPGGAIEKKIKTTVRPLTSALGMRQCMNALNPTLENCAQASKTVPSQ